MKIGFLINDIAELAPTQTTSMLMHRAAKAGHQAWAVPVDALQVQPGPQVTGHAVAVANKSELEETLADMRAQTPRATDLGDLDALMVRTNPARDGRSWAHDTALECSALLAERGVFVANRPAALRRSGSKLMLARMPAEVLPHTLVTRDLGALEQFLREAPGDVVVKPLAGTRGQDVFRIEAGRTTNLRQMFDVLTRDGYCVAQHFVPEAEDGDVRLVLLDGQPLRVGEQIAAVRRIPGDSDFRSNIAVGGRAAPVEVTATMRAVADAIGPVLAAQGLWLVGLDLIGSKVVEVNVFSTGGLGHAEQFYGVPFVDVILQWVAARAAG